MTHIHEWCLVYGTKDEYECECGAEKKKEQGEKEIDSAELRVKLARRPIKKRDRITAMFRW